LSTGAANRFHTGTLLALLYARGWYLPSGLRSIILRIISKGTVVSRQPALYHLGGVTRALGLTLTVKQAAQR
jgi:hypothetical protein